MARRRGSKALGTALKIAFAYEALAYGWNYYQYASGGGAGFVFPLDGIAYLIGYPGQGVPGLLTGGAGSISGYMVSRGR